MVGRENLAACGAEAIDEQRGKVAEIVAGVVAEMNMRGVDRDRVLESRRWLEEAFLSNVVTVSGGQRSKQEVVVNRNGDKKMVNGVAIGEQFVYDVRTLRNAEREVGGERGHLMGRVREEYESGVKQGVERAVDAKRAGEILAMDDRRRNGEIFDLFGGNVMRGMGGIVMRVLEEKAGEGNVERKEEGVEVEKKGEEIGDDMRVMRERLERLEKLLQGRGRRELDLSGHVRLVAGGRVDRNEDDKTVAVW